MPCLTSLSISFLASYTQLNYLIIDFFVTVFSPQNTLDITLLFLEVCNTKMSVLSLLYFLMLFFSTFCILWLFYWSLLDSLPWLSSLSAHLLLEGLREPQMASCSLGPWSWLFQGLSPSYLSADPGHITS